MSREDGQAVIEFLIGTSLVLVILAALGGISTWLRSEGPEKGSMLHKTYAEAPYTGASSEGVNVYAIEDVLLH